MDKLRTQAYQAYLLYSLAIHGWSIADILEKITIKDHQIIGAHLPTYDEFVANIYPHQPSLMRTLLQWPSLIDAYMRDVTHDEKENLGLVAIDFAAACFKDMPLEDYSWCLEHTAMTDLLKEASSQLEEDVSHFMFIIERDYAFDKSDALIAADQIKKDYRASHQTIV